MGLIASINGATRKVFLNPAEAIGGILTFHPTVDLYAAYKELRAADESVRPYNAFMRAEGNLPKGGGKYTPRFTMLLEGTKLVIPAGVTRVNITGELLTDDGSDPIDVSLITGPCRIDYQPAEAEIIRVTTSGSELTASDVAAAVVGHADFVLMSTRLAEAWGRLGLDPSAPLVTGQTSITFGDIVMAMTGDATETTVTRQ